MTISSDAASTRRQTGPYGACTREIDHDVAHDREEPRAQRTELVVETIGGAPRADERLLHRFLGKPAVAERAHREAVELRPVRGVDGAHAVIGRQSGLRIHHDRSIRAVPTESSR